MRDDEIRNLIKKLPEVPKAPEGEYHKILRRVRSNEVNIDRRFKPLVIALISAIAIALLVLRPWHKDVTTSPVVELDSSWIFERQENSLASSAVDDYLELADAL